MKIHSKHTRVIEYNPSNKYNKMGKEAETKASSNDTDQLKNNYLKLYRQAISLYNH